MACTWGRNRASIRSFTSVLGTATTSTSSVSSTAAVGPKQVVQTASGSWARSAVVHEFHSSSASPTCRYASSPPTVSTARSTHVDKPRPLPVWPPR